jgi:hypothetical protein
MTVLDTVFSGPRKFEIVLTQCDNSYCRCQTNYLVLYWENHIKKEFKDDYYKRQFIPILYCNIIEKPKKSSSQVKPVDSIETLHGTESHHRVVFNPCFTKDKQRFLEKAWITIQMGQNLFKYKHPNQKTFSLKDFCVIVQNGELLNNLKFDCDCLESLNQQIHNYFI